MTGKRVKSIEKLKKIFSKQRQSAAPENASSLSSSRPEPYLGDVIVVSAKPSPLKTSATRLGWPYPIRRPGEARREARQDNACKRTPDSDNRRSGDNEPDIDGKVFPEETSALIARKLRAFDTSVAKLDDSTKKSIKEAMTKCPNLLDNSFKLQFLRCDDFNEILAAKRYAKYWDMRIQLFGPERAFLPLTPKEAQKINPKKVLEDDCSLNLSMTLSKDPWCNSFDGNPELHQIAAVPVESMVRAVWCLFHAALEDDAPLADLRLSRFGSQVIRDVAPSLQTCLPLRGIAGIHRCIPPMIAYSPSRPSVDGGTNPSTSEHPCGVLGEWVETASLHLC